MADNMKRYPKYYVGAIVQGFDSWFNGRLVRVEEKVLQDRNIAFLMCYWDDSDKSTSAYILLLPRELKPVNQYSRDVIERLWEEVI